MRGKQLHNAIVGRLAGTCRDLDAWVCPEAYLGRDVGFGDLVTGDGHTLLLVEVEFCPSRVAQDVRKARALGADGLIVVTPNKRIRGACERALDRAELRESAPWLDIRVLTLGAAHKALEACFSIGGTLNGLPATNRNNAINSTIPAFGDQGDQP